MKTAWLTDTVTSDLDRALHYTLLWGLDAVELRTVGGASERVPFVNEAKLRRRLDEHNIAVVAIVPGLFEGMSSDRVAWLNEVVQMQDVFTFCKRIGCPRVVISCFASTQNDGLDTAVEALQKAGSIAEVNGLILAVLNEFDMACQTGRELATMLEAVDHSAVRAAWSPADALRAGEPASVGFKALAGRIELVRCRDGAGRGNDWEEMTLGAGAVGWPDILHQLKASDFMGPLSLEVFVEPRPKQGLRMATELIKRIRETG